MLRHMQLGFLKPRLLGNLWLLNGKSISQGVLSTNCRRHYNSYDCILQNGPYILPNGVALAYSCQQTTPKYVECECADLKKIDKKCISINALKCPALLEDNVHEMFPTTATLDHEPGLISIINIRYSTPKEKDKQEVIEHFILSARKLCMKIQRNFWADFVNPISGRPFFTEEENNKMYTMDCRFRGINMEFAKLNSCLVIEPNKESSFTGAVFTAAPLKFLKNRI